MLCEDVALARTGLMIYGPDETPIEPGPEGIVKVIREPDDIFTAETIASAQGKPVTNDHPDEDVTPENWRALSVGTMLNVRRGDGGFDDLMIGDLLITDKAAIQAVQNGKTEVSLGYDADYVETAPGTARQKNLIINHIALVEQGRCGPRCSIRDSKPEILRSEPMKKSNRILDALMKAFKAKDSAEVEQLAEKVADELETMPDGTVVADDETTLPTLAEVVAKNDAEHTEMRAEIAALREALEALKPAAPAADDGEMPEAALDEIPEELREQAAKARDSAFLADSFQSTVADAEILVPGVRIPTFDAAAKPGHTVKVACNFRRTVIDLAYVQPSTRPLIDDLLAGKTLDTKNMTCDAARTLFKAAAAAKRKANNELATQTQDGKAAVKKGPMTLAEINAFNRARYAAS